MPLKQRFASIIVGIGAFLLGFVLLYAQGADSYKTRLSAVPADQKTRADLSGLGTVTATLSGTKLTINGTFDGLRSPATAAKLHTSVAAGVRGPAISDLTISKALNGSISGSVDLNAQQVAALKKGGLYIEIISEKAPEGVLWGWLLH